MNSAGAALGLGVLFNCAEAGQSAEKRSGAPRLRSIGRLPVVDAFADDNCRSLAIP